MYQLSHFIVRDIQVLNVTVFDVHVVWRLNELLGFRIDAYLDIGRSSVSQ